jgi:hypothetical protein
VGVRGRGGDKAKNFTRIKNVAGFGGFFTKVRRKKKNNNQEKKKKKNKKKKK